MFRSSLIDYDYHDLAAQKQILLDAFAGHTEWKIRDLLDAASHDSELYFDSVSQIHMSSWHSGRVVLVGDAAYCASPLSGRGTSLAMTSWKENNNGPSISVRCDRPAGGTEHRDLRRIGVR